jgi:hypothetical protein
MFIKHYDRVTKATAMRGERGIALVIRYKIGKNLDVGGDVFYEPRKYDDLLTESAISTQFVRYGTMEDVSTVSI